MALYTACIPGIVRSVVLSIFKTLVLMFTSLGGDAIGSLLLYLLVVLSPAGIAQGWRVHLRYFMGGGA